MEKGNELIMKDLEEIEGHNESAPLIEEEDEIRLEDYEKPNEEPNGSNDKEEDNNVVKSGKSKMKSVEQKGKGKEVEWKGPPLLYPKDSWLERQRVNVYCQTKNIFKFKSNMSGTQLRSMMSSFIRNYTFVPNTNFPSQILLSLLKRRVESEKPSTLRFNLEGTVVEFGMRDFCLITGLKCTGSTKVNWENIPQSTIMARLFPHNKNPSVDEFIKEAEKIPYDDDEFVVKVFKLMVIEKLLLPNQGTNQITNLHLGIVEDKKVFEQYPWGRLSFNLLLHSIKKTGKSRGKTSIAIPGMTYALIYWAFEIIPKLSKNGKYASILRVKLPRFINWGDIKTGTCEKLDIEVFNSQIVVKEMKPKEKELATGYMKDFADYEEIKNKGKMPMEGNMEDDVDLKMYSDDEFGEKRLKKKEKKGTTSNKIDYDVLAELRNEVRDVKIILQEGFAQLIKNLTGNMNNNAKCSGINEGAEETKRMGKDDDSGGNHEHSKEGEEEDKDRRGQESKMAEKEMNNLEICEKMTSINTVEEGKKSEGGLADKGDDYQVSKRVLPERKRVQDVAKWSRIRVILVRKKSAKRTNP